MVTRGYSWLLVCEFPKITVQHCSPFFFCPRSYKVYARSISFLFMGHIPHNKLQWSYVQHGECRQGMLNVTQWFRMFNFISSYVKLVDSKTLHISSWNCQYLVRCPFFSIINFIRVFILSIVLSILSWLKYVIVLTTRWQNCR